MSKSKIQWTDETWNVTTGCTRKSAGCDNCYAVGMTKRLAGIEATKEKYGGLVNEGKDHFNGKVKIHPEVLKEPLSWRKPRKVFVNSMSDLFHPSVPFEFIDQVFEVIAKNPRHIFQILTKRPKRMSEFFKWQGEKIKDLGFDSIPTQSDDPLDYIDALPNAWLGTSVENQEAADERIPHLLNCPAAVRFLSCEPLLGPLNFRWTNYAVKASGLSYRGYLELHGSINQYESLKGIHQVIVGGESGHKARPMHPDWARSLRDQCQKAGVDYFFKQWGTWVSEFHPEADPSTMKTDDSFVTHTDRYGKEVDPQEKAEDYYGEYMIKVGKKKAGRKLDGREWNQSPTLNQSDNG